MQRTRLMQSKLCLTNSKQIVHEMVIARRYLEQPDDRDGSEQTILSLHSKVFQGILIA